MTNMCTSVNEYRNRTGTAHCIIYVQDTHSIFVAKRSERTNERPDLPTDPTNERTYERASERTSERNLYAEKTTYNTARHRVFGCSQRRDTTNSNLLYYFVYRKADMYLQLLPPHRHSANTHDHSHWLKATEQKCDSKWNRQRFGCASDRDGGNGACEYIRKWVR